MNGKDLSFCKKWFECYTSSVHCPDAEIKKNIDLKLRHTYRVCANITEIAGSLGMKKEDLAIAQALAIFHDVDSSSSGFLAPSMTVSLWIMLFLA